MPTTSYPSSEGELGRRLNQLTVVYSLVEAVNSAATEEAVYERAMDGIRSALEADRAAVLVEDEHGVERYQAWHGLSARFRAATEGFSPWADAASGGRRPVAVTHVASASGLAGLRDVYRAEGIGSAAFLPMRLAGRRGQIVLYNDGPAPFESGEIGMAMAIVDRVASIVDRGQRDSSRAGLLDRLEASREVLEAVVRLMPAGVLIAEAPSGRLLLQNDEVAAIWRRELSADGVADYAGWCGFTPDGRRYAAEEWPLARAVILGRSVEGEELEIQRGDGSRGMIRFSAAPLEGERGRVVAAVATVLDVTEAHEEERRRRFLAEAARALGSSLDYERTLDRVAQLAVAQVADWCMVLMGGTAGEPLRWVAGAHADPERAPLVARLAQEDPGPGPDSPSGWVLRTGRPLLVPELSREALESATRESPERFALLEALDPVSLMAVPLTARGETFGVLVLASSDPGRRYRSHDLELAQELARRAADAVDNARLYREAEAANRAKARFLGVMSHEFRTPLSAIYGYTDLLRSEIDGHLNERQRQHLHRIRASVQHLTSMVDEILAYSRMESGQKTLVRIADVDLAEVARESIALVEPIAEAGGLRLECSIPDRVELATDAGKLHQILLNLLSNAVRYTREGRVSLTVEPSPDSILLAVEDTGVGIEPDSIDRIFEPFWQAGAGADGRASGTGLGLSVARHHARLLGGDIEVRSEPGVGSRFSLRLPRTPPEAVSDR